MGVSGAGKTTIGKLLSEHTGIPFFDADDFHSSANKQKMQAGIALTDEDRRDWLKTLHELALGRSEDTGAIIACSALKAEYRDILASGVPVPVYWVFLRGSYELIRQRMLERKGHFMPESLLRSQFETLEIPPGAITIDIDQSPRAITEAIEQALRTRIIHPK